MNETARAWKSLTKVTTVYPAEIAATVAATNWLSGYHDYGLAQINSGHTTPLTYFEAYNTGDFMAAAGISIGANALLAFTMASLDPEGTRTSVKMRRLLAFGISSAIVVLGETLAPKGFMGNTPDVMDIPMGIAGAALPILVGTTGEKIIDTTFKAFTKTPKQRRLR